MSPTTAAGRIVKSALDLKKVALLDRRKAFKLKLEAQTLLCQRQVELNTRAAAKPESMSAVAGR